MRIVIGNVNTNNIDSLTWFLGEAGLAGMNTSMGDTTQVVNVDVKDLISQEFGGMLLELYRYNFTVIITK